MLKYIDLFSGAGGLSYGFHQTGRFELLCAVEKNPSAQNTFKTNLATDDTTLYDDILDFPYNDFKNELNGEELDLIIGGPPCQGFSNANRQKNSLINGNNQLVKEYVKAIETLKPRSFVLENVKTFNSDKHYFFVVDGEHESLREHGITIQKKLISICDSTLDTKLILSLLKKGKLPYIKSTEESQRLISDARILFKNIAKNKQIINSEKNNKLIKKLLRNTATSLEKHNHFLSNVVSTTLLDIRKFINQRSFTNFMLEQSLKNALATIKLYSVLDEILQEKITIRKVIQRNNTIFLELDAYNVYEYVSKRLEIDYTFESTILDASNFGIPQKRERFFMIAIRNDQLAKTYEQIKPLVETKVTISEAIIDLACVEPNRQVIDSPLTTTDHLKITNDYLNKMCRGEQIHNHIVTDSRSLSITRFTKIKQGENFHDLDDSLKTNYSDPTRTQSSIYKRLSLNEVSGTVTNVRKAMWIHPTEDRAISIREAARLQSFPDNFIFCGSKDSQYQQIGNAVPPLLSNAIATHILNLLK